MQDTVDKTKVLPRCPRCGFGRVQDGDECLTCKAKKRNR